MTQRESQTLDGVGLDELDLWPPPDPAIVEREPRKCRHPKWERMRAMRGQTTGGKPALLEETCGACGHVFDSGRQRKGKNNRKRGLSLQLEHARRLGLTNLQGNGAADAKSETVYGNAAFVAQMKSGDRFPGWMQRELDYLPRTGGRTPLLVVIETPGPGRKARALVVMEERDFVELHVGGGNDDQ